MSTHYRAIIGWFGSIVGLFGLVVLFGSWADRTSTTLGWVLTVVGGAMFLFGWGKYTVAQQKIINDAYDQKTKELMREKK